MAKERKQLSFTFEDPNAPKAFEQQFRRIMIARLVSMHGRSGQ